jgi:deoxycytidylate deaminase/dephospho-CoA kinase
MSSVVTMSKATESKHTDSRALLRDLASNELIFAVVGPVGSGTSEIAKALKELMDAKKYETRIIKARDVIDAWDKKNGASIPSSAKGISLTTALQNAGDRLREATKDNAAVALRLIERIRSERAQQKGESVEKDKPVDPDERPRAFVLDSLRNPAEVLLLRSVYQEAFCLIGVVCEEQSRLARLHKKYPEAGRTQIEELMERDEKADQKHGQQVADTFHLSDAFVDNTEDRLLPSAGGMPKANPSWMVMDDLGRLVDVLTHSRIVRPRPGETAMFHAYGARMRSACLSRQVGAALIDRQGNIVATGSNEVPRAGGGVYGGVFAKSSDIDPEPTHDHRCFIHGGYCRNTREQNEIIEELLSNVIEFKNIKVNDDLIKRIRRTRIGQLIEFSRSVHAEMDALLSAGRQGVSPVGTRLFVTTFPCHNCARHIVSAGVDEVQFIEPYLKSRALPLHGDSITTTRDDWTPPSTLSDEELRKMQTAPQVLFRPFTGIAPRLYRRAFFKDRDLKNDFTGDLLTSFGPSDGTGSSQALRVNYAQVEAKLATAAQEVDG